jgi:DUF4097 and DUF4098 domain-containing protein YvlB
MRLVPLPSKFRKLCVTLLLAGVVCTGYLGSALADGSYEEETKDVISLKGETAIVIAAKRSDVTVTGEKGRGDITLVIVKKVRAGSEEEAKRLAAETGVEIDHADGELVFSTKYPKEFESRKNIFSYILQRGPKIDMKLYLTIPAEFDLRVGSASGDIVVAKLDGIVRLSAASGSIETNELGNNLSAGTASGDIDVDAVAGSVELNSASGDIFAREVAGDASVETASGDVELIEIGGDLTSKTASGDITVKGVGAVTYNGVSGSARFVGVRGSISASASSGDLSFHLVPEAEADYRAGTSSGDILLHFLSILPGGYVLKAGTTSGDISASLPIRLQKVGRNHIAGIVREGKSKVILETASGDISISEPEE